MDFSLIVGALISLAILVVVIGVGHALERVGVDRLEEYVGDRLTQAHSQSRLARSVSKLSQGSHKVFRSIAVFDRLAHGLQRADLRLTVTEYLFFWLLITATAVAVGRVISGNWLPALVTGLFGALTPHFFLRFRQGSRLHAFDSQLGNILLQLSGSMRAGYGLLQAIDFVSHEMPPPAGPEFGQVVRDVKLGRSVMAALDDLTERVGSDDLTLIITSIHIHHETGGNLTEILETVAGTIRERVRIKGELRSLTAQQRYSGYVLAALPILMFFVLMLINPQYESRLFKPGPTLCIPIGAIASMLLGFLAIRYIVSIEM